MYNYICFLCDEAWFHLSTFSTLRKGSAYNPHNGTEVPSHPVKINVWASKTNYWPSIL